MRQISWPNGPSSPSSAWRLFVAHLGLFAPERMDRSFTWALLPPLHARFVGVAYLARLRVVVDRSPVPAGAAP